MHIRLERAGEVTELVWASPGLNLFTTEVAGEFEQALDDIPSGTRALLLRAEGKVFCAGVRVQEFAAMDAATGATFSRRCLTLVQRLEALPFPTVAAVHSVNLTIGLELALGCDFIWAAHDARMGVVEASVGLTPAAGATQRLLARAGIGRATEMVLTGAVYDAARLHEWGVVDRVVPATELTTAVRDFAADLAAGPTAAAAVAKRILHTARDKGVSAADRVTPELAGPVMATEDAASGIASVIEHGLGTKPVFSGR